MWTTDCSTDIDLAPDTVWRGLRAVETGQVPMASGDLRELDSDFTLGGTMTSTPVGLDPVSSTITELMPGEVLAIRTDFNGLILLLRHTVTPLEGGGTRLVRRLEVTGSPGAPEEAVGRRISADYPEALAEIIAVARGDAAEDA